MRILAIALAFIALGGTARADDLTTDAGLPGSFRLNPTAIRAQLLSRNLSITQALRQVHDAKDQLAIARGNLAPSLNLGGMLDFSGGPSFILSSVQYLLPFLLPSNWFNYFQQKDLFEAGLISYRILELNTYSSALSIYFTVLADVESQQVYQQQYEDLKQIYDMKKERMDGGIGSPETVAHAKAQAEMALVRVSQMTELVKQETASVRSALSLPLATSILFDKASMSVSDYEDLPIQTAVDHSAQVAPELQQIEYLAKAATHAKWSKVFGIATSASLSSTTTAGKDAPFFSDLRGSGSVGIGFSYYPAIRLSNRNIEEIEFQKTIFNQQNTAVLESAINSVVEARRQFTLASSAEAGMKSVYEAKLEKYNMGIGTFLPVLTARQQMSEAQLARIKASRDLNLLRITLHRAMGTDQFADIQGCRLKRDEYADLNPVGRFFKKLFRRSSTNHQAIDEACREGVNQENS